PRARGHHRVRAGAARRRGVPGAARGGTEAEGARGLRQRRVREGRLRALLARRRRGRRGERRPRQETGARQLRPPRSGVDDRGEARGSGRGGCADGRQGVPGLRGERIEVESNSRFDLPEDTTATSAPSVAGGAAALLAPTDHFPPRHIGPSDAEIAEMLSTLGLESLDALVAETLPDAIRLERPLALPAARGEHEVLAALRARASRNQVFRSFIGMGYYGCLVPGVIQRNVLENPGWYTQYTPYQAEIAQGRLEALLNFQTMVADLTALPLANASLLDEATAAAEAMHMCHALVRGDRRRFFVADDCHPQTIAVV